jgi:hypothetical protein
LGGAVFSEDDLHSSGKRDVIVLRRVRLYSDESGDAGRRVISEQLWRIVREEEIDVRPRRKLGIESDAPEPTVCAPISHSGYVDERCGEERATFGHSHDPLFEREVAPILWAERDRGSWW